MSARLPAIVLACAALGLGACGGTGEDSAADFRGEERRVAEAVEDLQEAAARRDANRICEQLLAKDLRERIRQSGVRNCEAALDDALEDADAFELNVKKIDISGDTATVEVVSEAGDDERTDTLRLAREGANWKIAALAG